MQSPAQREAKRQEELSTNPYQTPAPKKVDYYTDSSFFTNSFPYYNFPYKFSPQKERLLLQSPIKSNKDISQDQYQFSKNQAKVVESFFSQIEANKNQTNKENVESGIKQEYKNIIGVLKEKGMKELSNI